MKGVAHTSAVGHEFGLKGTQARNDACAQCKADANID